MSEHKKHLTTTGMIPAVAPPFAMTRWTPQTRQNCEPQPHLTF
jgi:hypothetical protein